MGNYGKYFKERARSIAQIANNEPDDQRWAVITADEEMNG
jgi:hypothetical protein